MVFLLLLLPLPDPVGTFSTKHDESIMTDQLSRLVWSSLLFSFFEFPPRPPASIDNTWRVVSNTSSHE